MLSCHSNSSRGSGLNGEMTQKDAEEAFLSSIRSTDSLTVMQQGNQCMDLLKEGRIDEALSMVYALAIDTVVPLSEGYAEQLRQRFTLMPVLDYSFVYLAFSTEGNNDLCYRYEFAPKDEKGEAPAMRFTFNPVKVGDKWCLTLKDLGMSSKAMSRDNQIHDMAPAPEKIKMMNENLD